MPDLHTEVAAKNKTNIKANPADGVTYPYQFAVVDGQGLLLIGGGHSSKAVGAVRSAPGKCAGDITVKKGGLMGAGEMTISGFRGDKTVFQRAIADFSKKRAKFI